MSSSENSITEKLNDLLALFRVVCVDADRERQRVIELETQLSASREKMLLLSQENAKIPDIALKFHEQQVKCRQVVEAHTETLLQMEDLRRHLAIEKRNSAIRENWIKHLHAQAMLYREKAQSERERAKSLEKQVSDLEAQKEFLIAELERFADIKASSQAAAQPLKSGGSS